MRYSTIRGYECNGDFSPIIKGQLREGSVDERCPVAYRTFSNTIGFGYSR